MFEGSRLTAFSKVSWFVIPIGVLALLVIIFSECLQASIMRIAYQWNYPPLTSFLANLEDPRYANDIDYWTAKAKAVKSVPKLSKSIVMANTLERLSSVSDPAQAPELLRRAIFILENDSEPKLVAFVPRRKLTAFFISQHQPEEALQVIQDTIVRTEKYYGPNSDEVADLLLQRASFCPKTPEYSLQLESDFKRALDILARLHSEDSAKVNEALREFASFYVSQSKYESAESVYRRRLRIAEKQGPVWLRAALLDLARILPKVGKAREAAQLNERARRLPVPVCGDLSIKLCH